MSEGGSEKQRWQRLVGHTFSQMVHAGLQGYDIVTHSYTEYEYKQKKRMCPMF